MPRKKNYQAPGAAPTVEEQATGGLSGGPQAAAPPLRDPGDADIDLRELLGPDVRLWLRTIRLSPALGHGIDDWVFAVSDVIRSLLRGGRSPASGRGYMEGMYQFFEYITAVQIHRRAPDSATECAPDRALTAMDSDGDLTQSGPSIARSKPATPADLSPLHIEQFIGWLKRRAEAQGWSKHSARRYYVDVKSVLVEMFARGTIAGERKRFFKRGAFKRSTDSRQTAFSDGEQERLAAAIRADLSAVHHGRLNISSREAQSLRFLVVGHRMGHNATPLLELKRDAMKQGLLPGTIRVQTAKHRGKKICSRAGRGAPIAPPSEVGSASGPVESKAEISQQDQLTFSLAEGAVIQQAIATTQHLVDRAPAGLRNRVWLYEVAKNTGVVRKGDVSCLGPHTVFSSVKALVARHKLLGDDGQPLNVNMSRFRKSLFDRLLRLTDGDMVVTANVMGNTPQVASTNYPSMNAARQAEAASFMNEDYVQMMRPPSVIEGGDNSGKKPLRVIEIGNGTLATSEAAGSVIGMPAQTPVSGCRDPIRGEHAPGNGSHCDRFVMCLFCSSFAIVGTVDELWRLLSFQSFARSELAYLDEMLGSQRSDDRLLEDLRDRYRLAIPFIDDVCRRKFSTSRVAQARNRTAAGLHPFWELQMKSSRRARHAQLGSADGEANFYDGGRVGT